MRCRIHNPPPSNTRRLTAIPQVCFAFSSSFPRMDPPLSGEGSETPDLVLKKIPMKLSPTLGETSQRLRRFISMVVSLRLHGFLKRLGACFARACGSPVERCGLMQYAHISIDTEWNTSELGQRCYLLCVCGTGIVVAFHSSRTYKSPEHRGSRPRISHMEP